MAKVVRSVERAINILFCVAESDQPIGLSDICRTVGLDKATAIRLLLTLEQAGLVARDPLSRRHLLGPEIARLQMPGHADLRSVCRPRLEGLKHATDETVSLVRARGLERVVIDVVAATHELSVVPAVGTAHPIYSGASGKVIMAFLPEADRERIIELTQLKPLSPNAVSDRVEFLEVIKKVRANGYAYSIGDVTVGASALAAPVLDATGQLVAVVSLRGPEVRLPVERLEELAPLVVEATNEISRDISYPAERRRSA